MGSQLSPQQPPAPWVTRRAILPYLSRTVVRMSSLMSRSLPLAAGGEQADQIAHRFRPHRVVHEPLLPAAGHQAGATEEVQVVGQRGTGDLELGLDLSGRQLPPRPSQEEEDLQPGEMGQGLEGFDVPLAGLQVDQRDLRFHSSKITEL